MKINELKHFRFFIEDGFETNELQCADCYCWDRYYDAPVCINGEEDVTCGTERYRGCYLVDCADGPGLDDQCCWGPLPGPSDNIDHYMCSSWDAGWGGVCPWGKLL
jgi:hypothetical protein